MNGNSENDVVRTSSVRLSGNRVPRHDSKAQFYCQFIALFTILLASVINLSIDSKNSSIWLHVLGWAGGLILPGPKIKTAMKNVDFEGLIPTRVNSARTDSPSLKSRNQSSLDDAQSV